MYQSHILISIRKKSVFRVCGGKDGIFAKVLSQHVYALTFYVFAIFKAMYLSHLRTFPRMDGGKAKVSSDGEMPCPQDL